MTKKIPCTIKKRKNVFSERPTFPQVLIRFDRLATLATKLVVASLRVTVSSQLTPLGEGLLEVKGLRAGWIASFENLDNLMEEQHA
jgi:hypothetical protein